MRIYLSGTTCPAVVALLPWATWNHFWLFQVFLNIFHSANWNIFSLFFVRHFLNVICTSGSLWRQGQTITTGFTLVTALNRTCCHLGRDRWEMERERGRERLVNKEEWKWRKISVDCRVFRWSLGYNFVDNPSITNYRGCTALCSRLGSFCRFVWGAATSRKSQSPNRKSICAAVRVLLVATTLHVAACYTWLPWLAIVASRVYT